MSDAEIHAFFERRDAPAVPSEEQVLLSLRAAMDTATKVSPLPCGIETASALSGPLVSALLHNEIAAVNVPGFFAAEATQKLAAFLREQTFERWDGTDMFFGLGIPRNTMMVSAAECLRYFDAARPAMHALRKAAGGVSPIDRLRLELDELWAPGAQISTANPFGRKMLAGLARCMRPEGMLGTRTKQDGLIHVDASPFLSASHGGFTANVYIEMPAAGGELCVWPVSLTDAESAAERAVAFLLGNSFDSPLMDEVQATLLRLLPSPCVLRPAPGSLVMFNAGRPHAVRGFAAGIRSSCQTFIEHRENAPLALCS
jgi:hypothetical protein